MYQTARIKTREILRQNSTRINKKFKKKWRREIYVISGGCVKGNHFVLCVCVCVCICMYVCTVCMYVQYVCMYVCMYACMYACMHVCMYACMYVCMYVCNKANKMHTPYINAVDQTILWMRERNTIKLHVQVILRMNTWMFETCRRLHLNVIYLLVVFDGAYLLIES
jgi:hypothetical protein